MPAAPGGNNLRGPADGGNEASEEDEDDEGEDEECGENMAVSGKLAIHLDTGETSRECCLINNRTTPLAEDGGSCRSQLVSKEDSTHCFSDEKPLFVKKYKGSGVSSATATPPVPPPRSKSKEGSFSAAPSGVSGGQERASPRGAAAAAVALAGNKNDRSPADKSTYYDAQEGPVFVLEAAASGGGGLAQPTKQVHGKPFQGSLDENKNVEFSEKKEVRSDESEVSPSYSCSDRADRGGSAGKTSSSSKHLDPSRSRRKGVVSMPPNELKEYSSTTKSTKSDRSAKRISLDDLSSAFQGVGGQSGGAGTAGDLKRQGSSSRSRCSQSPASGGGAAHAAASHEYLSDESVPNGSGGDRREGREGGRYSSSRSTAANSHSTHSGGSGGGGGIRETGYHHHQRRSKSEESLLDWVDHVRAGQFTPKPFVIRWIRTGLSYTYPRKDVYRTIQKKTVQIVTM